MSDVKERLLLNIAKISPVISQRAHNSMDHASVYQDLLQRLALIEKFCNEEDFSVAAKQKCDMGGPLLALYDGAKGELPELGKLIFEINRTFQGMSIKTLDESQAIEFLLRRS